jgi:hypothetical protein
MLAFSWVLLFLLSQPVDAQAEALRPLRPEQFHHVSVGEKRLTLCSRFDQQRRPGIYEFPLPRRATSPTWRKIFFPRKFACFFLNSPGRVTDRGGLGNHPREKLYTEEG